MKKKLFGITDLIGQDVIVCIHRKPLDKYPLIGFVVGVSGKLLLMHLVDDNSLNLNGYAALRLEDIRSYKVDKSFITRALRLINRKPLVPEEIDLTDWESLLDSVKNRCPLLMIEMEKKKPGAGFVGQVARQTPRSVRLEEVNPKAEWTKIVRYAYKDITRINFDNGYVNGLAQLVEHEGALG